MGDCSDNTGSNERQNHPQGQAKRRGVYDTSYRKKGCLTDTLFCLTYIYIGITNLT